MFFSCFDELEFSAKSRLEFFSEEALKFFWEKGKKSLVYVLKNDFQGAFYESLAGLAGVVRVVAGFTKTSHWKGKTK